MVKRNRSRRGLLIKSRQLVPETARPQTQTPGHYLVYQPGYRSIVLVHRKSEKRGPVRRTKGINRLQKYTRGAPKGSDTDSGTPHHNYHRLS